MSEHLDRALEAGKHALGDLWGIGNDDRIFARAVIADLLKDCPPPSDAIYSKRRGWYGALAEIRRRAGIGEG